MQNNKSLSPDKKRTKEVVPDLSLILLNTEEPFVMMDVNLDIIAYNSEFERQYSLYFGVKITRGVSILNYAQKSNEETLRTIYRRVLTGATLESELEIESSGSQKHSFLLKYKPAYDEQKNIVGIFVSSTEITELKKSKKLLTHSEVRFRSILNNANDIIFLTDRQGKIEYISPALERITGFEPAEMVGKSIFSIVHPEHLSLFYTVLEKALENPGVPVPRTNRFLHKEGHYVWVEGAVTNLLNDPGVEAIVANFHDITLAKQAEEKLRLNEERLRAIIENEPECVKVVDLSGKLIDMNVAGLRMLAANSLDQLKGQDVMSLIHPEDVHVYREMHKKSCLGEPASAGFRVVNLEQNIMWMETNSVPLKNSEGTIYAVLSVTRDVTERKKTQDELEKNEKRYRALVENAGDVIAIIGVDGKPNYVSPSVKRVLGYSDEEALLLNLDLIMHPDDLEPLKAIIRQAVESHGAESKYKVVRIKHKSGTWRWCETVITSMLHDPLLNGIVHNFRDITEKIASEQEKEFDNTNLHALINNTNDLMWSISRNGNLISFNKPFDDMIKRVSGNTVVKGGEAPIHGFPEDQLKKWQALYARAFQGESFTIVEHSAFYQEYWSEISFYPIRQGGEIVGTACFSRDITERKLFERKLENTTTELINYKKELEHKESRLKQAQAIAHVGNWELRLEDTTCNWSDEAYRIYGMEPSDRGLSLNEWKKFIHPDDLVLFEKEMERVNFTLVDSSLSHRILLADGTVRHVISESRFEFDAQNVPVGLYGIVHDITEQKETEERLQKNHHLLQKLTDKVPVAVYEFEMSDTGKLTFPFMSKAIEELVPDVNILLLTNDASSIFNAVHPEDVGHLIDSIMASRESMSDWLLEFRMLLPDRTVRWLHGFSRPERKEKSTIWYGYLQDITERKLAEEETRIAKDRYDFVAKATNDSIYDWNLETGKTLRSGDGLQKLFGYDPLSAMEEKGFWMKRMHPDDQKKCYAILQELILNPSATSCNQEYRFLKADGTYAYVFDKGFIIRDAKGKAVRIIGATQDITKTKEAELQLQKLNDSLEKRARELVLSNAELEQFAYIASHDLQEPLRMVTSFLTLLEKKYTDQLDDRAKQYIHFATDGAVRMRRLILDLLEYSRVGRQAHKEEPVDINQVLNDVVKLNKPLIDEKKAVIEWQNIPSVIGNRTTLGQVFHNIIGNSLKYQNGTTPPIVSITGSETALHWQFSITDNGIGIEERYFDKIFVVFQRLHNKDEYSGTGVGLSICKKIIESHHGRIWIQSEHGKGSTFYFTIAKPETIIHS